MTRLPRSRRPVRLSTVLAVGVVLGIVATRPLLDAIAESARRPTGRMGRLLYGPAPAGLAPYRRILDALGLRADDVLLEIGPGGGNFLARALEHGRRDPSAERRGTSRWPAGRPAMRRRQPALGRRVLTAVAMSQVFFWLPDPDRVLGEVRRVLCPGGRLAILGASNRPATGLLVLPYLRGSMRLYDDLARMLRSAGFTNVDVTSRGLGQYARATRGVEC